MYFLVAISEIISGILNGIDAIAPGAGHGIQQALSQLLDAIASILG